MGILHRIFTPKKKNSPDVLGRYPEYMQVHALPERRYLKTSRLLAIFILINLGIMLSLAGICTYLIERIDISIASRRAVNLFYIDTEKKRLMPAEHTQKTVSAGQLMVEAALRQYIMERHTIIWDNDKQGRLWGQGSFVQGLSAAKFVYNPFIAAAKRELEESRAKGYVRDVHLYELELIYENMWQAIIDTFDMPVPDPFNPLCECSDNSPKCIACKKEHTSNRQRYKIFIRANFSNLRGTGNPLGISIYSYHVIPMVVRDNSFWDTPRALKPEL